jgi:SAV_6107-like HEPN
MSPMTSATIPVRPLPRRLAPSALSLLRTSRQGLAEAAEASVPNSRYVAAHLAALRAAAAVLAVKGEPADAKGRRKPRSVWVLLTEVAPILQEWAAYFAAGAPKRAAAEAGLPRAVTSAEADDLMRDAEIFVSLVETTLGIAVQPTLPIAG